MTYEYGYSNGRMSSIKVVSIDKILEIGLQW